MTSSDDYRHMTARVRDLAADTESIRADYEHAEVRGESPDGSVHVLMKAGRILTLEIDPAALNHDNVYVATQVIAALRQAEEQSAQFLSSRSAPVVDAFEELRKLFP